MNYTHFLNLDESDSKSDKKRQSPGLQENLTMFLYNQQIFLRNAGSGVYIYLQTTHLVPREELVASKNMQK